ncbi:MAG: hypothetical protein U9M95_04645 [Candidatus Altiarchaeota archaeon]|nr:hypothetical protein [Candidatus Altiarchaeota archaeon]
MLEEKNNKSGKNMKTSARVFLLALAILSLPASADYRTLSFDTTFYRNGSVQVGGLSTGYGKTNLYSSQEGRYRVEICSKEKVLYAGNLTVGFITYVGVEKIVLNESRWMLTTPSYPSMEWIRFYHNNQIIQEINIPEKICVSDGLCEPYCLNQNDPDCVGGEIKTSCGNSICDPKENHKTCPMDCESGSSDAYCDKKEDGVCDPNCPVTDDPDCIAETTTITTSTLIPSTTTPDTVASTSTSPATTVGGGAVSDGNLLLYLLTTAVVLATAFFVYKKREDNKQAEEKQRKRMKLITWIEKQLRDGEDPEKLKTVVRSQGFEEELVDYVEKKLM